jgi:transketolase
MLKKYQKSPKNKPIAIIAKTAKGYPVSFMKNKALWHYRSPNKQEYKIALRDLNKNA